MTTPLQDTNKRVRNFVLFKYGKKGSESFRGYTDSTEPETLFGRVYIPTTKLGISRWTREGGLTEGELSITLPLKNDAGDVDSFVDRISSGEPNPMICQVQIMRVVDEGPSSDVRTRFRGEVEVATRNAGGVAGIVKFTCKTWKSKLNYALGLPIDLNCPWTLYDKNCGVPRATFTERGIVTVVNRTILTIPNLTTSTVIHGSPWTGFYWKHGWLESDDGVRLMIREWKAGIDTADLFLVDREPPADWLGAEIDVVAGCLKVPENCDFPFNNRKRYGGAGANMPTESPVYRGSK